MRTPGCNLSSRWRPTAHPSDCSRPGFAVIDFGAEECGPCQRMKPDLEQVAAADYPVTVVPTQMFVLPDGSPWQPPEGFSEEIGVQFTGQPQRPCKRAAAGLLFFAWASGYSACRTPCAG